jgi:hypothetical protein
MMFSTTALLGAMLAMGPLVANAHMTMLNPVPWGKPNNSPLDAGGSDFPCKAVAYTGGKANDWPVGSTQQLSLGGTAVHGGGSCQISVSTDKAPTKSSKWKVIYSIEGGCPPPPPGGGNYVEGTQKSLVFPFTIPEELPNGDLAMSWTWFNKIGAREIYQNCAPVTVTGGASDMSAFDALPDMAVANIASINTCKTTETFDYTFENPGQYSIKNGTGPYKALCGGAPSSKSWLTFSSCRRFDSFVTCAVLACRRLEHIHHAHHRHRDRALRPRTLRLYTSGPGFVIASSCCYTLSTSWIFSVSCSIIASSRCICPSFGIPLSSARSLSSRWVILLARWLRRL